MSTVDPEEGKNGAGGDALDPKVQNPDGTAKTAEQIAAEAAGNKDDDPSDPLNDIKDPVARAAAKRDRAISRRNAKQQKQDEDDEDEEDPVDTSGFATKDDLKKIATNEAKKLVPEHIKDLWSELTAVPLGGFDPFDAESIAKNMHKRFKLYIEDHPEKAPDPSVDLTSTSVLPNGGGGGNKKPQNARPLPGYKESAQPDSWYQAPK
jgi:hypothetical protein